MEKREFAVESLKDRIKEIIFDLERSLAEGCPLKRGVGGWEFSPAGRRVRVVEESMESYDSRRAEWIRCKRKFLRFCQGALSYV